MWAPANANTEINPAAHAGVCCCNQSSSTRRKTTSSRKGMAITEPIITVTCAARPRREVPRVLFLGICLDFYYFLRRVLLPKFGFHFDWGSVSQALVKPHLVPP